MNCPECGGDVQRRPSGFGACAKCGKLILRMPKPEPEASDDFGLPTGDVIVPDYTEALTGWRAWIVNTMPGEPPWLRSATHNAAWTPGRPMVAECKIDPGHIPGEDCGCGLYSAKTRAHLLSMPYHRYDLDKGEAKVMGEVALWGKVVEGTQGWRAQFGYPTRLYVPYEAHRMVRRLREAYGCEVVADNILSEKEAA